MKQSNGALVYAVGLGVSVLLMIGLMVWITAPDAQEAIETAGAVVGWLLVAVLLLVVYFVPSFIAQGRHHSSVGGVFVLNLCLGWTALGWLIALIWAASGQHRTA